MTRSSPNLGAPAVFLDRDGVIIVEKNFQIDPQQIEWIGRSIDAMKLIDHGFLKVIVSNQSGVARGLFSSQDVLRFNAALNEKLSSEGINIDGWYFCPHGPDDDCPCRKPRPGLLLEAARKLNINLEQSWMIGDKSSDVGAGRAVGIRTILVKTGYGGQEPAHDSFAADYIADDLYDAVKLINHKVGVN